MYHWQRSSLLVLFCFRPVVLLDEELILRGPTRGQLRGLGSSQSLLQIINPPKVLENMKRSMKQGKRAIQCFLGFSGFFSLPLRNNALSGNPALEFGICFCVGVFQCLHKVRPQKLDTKATAVGGKFLPHHKHPSILDSPD